MSDVNLAFVVLGTVAGLVVGRLSGRSTPKPTPEPSARPASPDGGRVTYFLTPMQMEQVRDAWRAIRDASKHDHLCLRVEWKSAHLDDLLRVARRREAHRSGQQRERSRGPCGGGHLGEVRQEQALLGGRAPEGDPGHEGHARDHDAGPHKHPLPTRTCALV